jgi:hypothetical protein
MGSGRVDEIGVGIVRKEVARGPLLGGEGMVIFSFG